MPVDKSIPICVTGATGFIASHIVEQLLEAGYKVNGTVRDLSKKESYQHLEQMQNAAENLKLFQASLLENGSYAESIKGCEVVIHTASPYSLNVSDPQKDLVDPAVNGTLNVFESCKEAKVKQVILTSSVAAITDSPENGHTYTEADWNSTSGLNRNPYYYSKTLAERAAWDFVKNLADDEKFKLVSINPFVVIGPTHIQSMNPSNLSIKQILDGTFPAVIDIGWGFVDVRDSAKAHILAFENDLSEGRYICCNQTVPMKDVIAFFREKYPDYALPTKDLSGGFGTFIVKAMSHFQPRGTGQYIRTNIGRHPVIDNSKIKKDLGLEFTDVWKSVQDTAEDLIAKGHVKPKPVPGAPQRSPRKVEEPVKVASVPEVKSEAKVEEKSEPEVQPEAKVEAPEPEVVEPEPQVQPEAKVEAPEPEVDVQPEVQAEFEAPEPEVVEPEELKESEPEPQVEAPEPEELKESEAEPEESQ